MYKLKKENSSNNVVLKQVLHGCPFERYWNGAAVLRFASLY